MQKVKNRSGCNCCGGGRLCITVTTCAGDDANFPGGTVDGAEVSLYEADVLVGTQTTGILGRVCFSGRGASEDYTVVVTHADYASASTDPIPIVVEGAGPDYEIEVLMTPFGPLPDRLNISGDGHAYELPLQPGTFGLTGSRYFQREELYPVTGQISPAGRDATATCGLELGVITTIEVKVIYSIHCIPDGLRFFMQLHYGAPHPAGAGPYGTGVQFFDYFNLDLHPSCRRGNGAICEATDDATFAAGSIVSGPFEATFDMDLEDATGPLASTLPYFYPIYTSGATPGTIPFTVTL